MEIKNEDILNELRNVFPKELTIAVQNVQIRKLQEENEKLIQKILLMAGVAIQDYNVASLAGQQEVKDIQQQKS